MRFIRPVGALASASILAGALLAAGCSKSSYSTSPTYGMTGGGGGGGGGTTTSFDSGSLTAPAGFDHTFSTAGTFGYHCIYHQSAGMVGTVVVATGGAASATVTASGTSFSPPTVTIAPGGSVHWSITGGTHTVTSN